jgi:hypothetical protein
MTETSISWERPAMKLLDRRDRYTRNAIMEDFDRDPQRDAIELEPDNFLTPVSDQRFSVLWRRLDGGQRVSVRAVIPLTNVPIDAAQFKQRPELLEELRAYVKRVVKSESKGEIEL